MKQKYGFVYIWYDKKRKMFYIGCHFGFIDDGYICSSSRMRKAYRRRPQDFKRRILKTNIPSRIELLDEEHKWLSLIGDPELSKKYYNASKRRFGHWSETQDKSGKNHPMFGKTHTEETRKKMSLSRIGQNPWNKGKTGVYSDETKQKMGDKNIGNLYNLGKNLSEESRNKMSLIRKGNIPWNKGRTGVYSDETKSKMSESSKGQIAWNKGKKCPELSGDNNGAKKLIGKTWKICQITGKRVWLNKC